jgi:hypothetical protein
MKNRIVLASVAMAGLVALGAGRTQATVAPEATSTAKPVTCALTTPCALAVNSSSGPGYLGKSTKGPGLSGASMKAAGVYGLSGSGSFLDPGVDGESNFENSGNDAGGLFGGKALTTGKGPEYGVVSYASFQAVSAETENGGTSAPGGSAVYALDPIKSVSGGGDYNTAVLAKSTVGTAVLGEANASPTVSIFGDAPVGFYSSVAEASGTLNPYAFAFFGETNAFGLDVHNSIDSSSIYVSSPSDFLAGSGSSGYFSIDYGGNELLSGKLTTSGGTYVRVGSSNGPAVLEYGSRTTAPQVEDVGEGQLTNGRASIAIDARLAATIDKRIAYHVFVTPEGDCNGLYVTQKTSAGFTVRELHGGHASLAFEYRIVAKPVDDNGVRLAAAPALAKRDDDGFAAAGPKHTLPAVLSPEQRLRQRFGDKAYAEELRALGEREAVAR